LTYSPEIFPLYEELFSEAHGHLKTAGFIQDLLRSGKNARRVGELGETVARQEAAITGSMDDLLKARIDATAAEKGLGTATKELEQFGAKPGALTSAKRGRNLALLGMGGAAAGIPLAHSAGEGDKKRTRNLAFGAGAATGLAAPQLVRGLGNIARGVGRTGVFPELQGYGNAAY
jgi:hypothetical protein